MQATRSRMYATSALAGVQWLFFIFANTIVIPLSVGQAFHLAPAAITASLERAFIYTGIACILQALLGHRLPIMEGHAGLWWGVVLSLALSAAAAGQSLTLVGGSLAVGFIFSGVSVMVLGIIGAGWWLRRLFNPVVTSTFYFLLGAQLTQFFLKGMLGLSNSTIVQPAITLFALVLMLAVMALSIWGRGLLSNFALLIGIVVGWPVFVLLFPDRGQALAPAGSELFALFPWGRPAFDAGLIASAFLAGLISTSNTYATFEGIKTIFAPADPAQYRRSFILSGLSSIVSGVLGLVPYAPYTSSIGFLRSTRILGRAPFILGAALLILLGVIPVLGQFFASLPLVVGDAVLFVAYMQLFGTAMSSLDGFTFTAKTIYRIALPVLFGLALMTIPSSAFVSIPALIRPLLQSGLVMGILLALILENTIHWKQ
ncbi:MAG: uracil/xanthine transporter [Ktedonobacteraceae bacterium]